MVNGRVGSPETEKLPVTLAAVMVRFVPIAVKVPVWDALLVPSGTAPKFKMLGLTLRPAPVPESPMAGSVLDALLVRDRVPEALPVAAGAKLILKLAF